MKKIIIFSQFLVILFSLLSCSTLKKTIESPKVKLEDVKISKLSFLHADLNVVLSILNPNNINFNVENLKYSLDINEKTISTGIMKEKIVVKGKEKTLVTLPIQVLYKDIASSALLLLKDEGIPFRVQGSVQVGPFTIPFDKSGSVKPSKFH